MLYDITCLGNWQTDQKHRTGVFRVADEVALGLKRSKRCDVRYCAFTALAEAEGYLLSDGQSARRMLAHSEAQRRLSSTVSPLRAVITGSVSDRRFSRRALRRIGYAGVQMADRIAGRLSEKVLRWADIFHSPIPELPRQIELTRSPQFRKFVTVYDLVAFVCPEYFEADHAAYLRGKLSTLGDVWVLCISEATRQDFVEQTRFDPARVFVTPLAAGAQFHRVTDERAISQARISCGIPPGADYFLSLCTLEPRKNLDRVIHSFARVVQQRELKTMSLVLVGNTGWKTERIFEATRAYPELKDRIIVTGFVPDEVLAPLYSGATAFVYMSLYEGFGLPPLEAMQCGVPVVVSNTSSLPEVVGDAGLMLDPQDDDALSQTLVDLASQPALRASMSARSLEQAARFSWSRTIDATIRAYQIALRS